MVPNQSSPQNQLIVVRIINVSFILSLAVYQLVARLMHQPASYALESLHWYVLAILAGLVLLGIVVFGNKIKGLPQGSVQILPFTMIRFALAEVVGVYGLVVAFGTGSVALLNVACLIAVGFLLVLFPKKEYL